MNGLHLGSLVALVRADASDYDKTMDDVVKKADKTAANLTRIGRRMSLAISLPLIGMQTQAVRTFAAFDDAMTEVEATMRGSMGNMRGSMESLAKTLAVDLGFSATNLAKEFVTLARAGNDVTNSMKQLPVVARFARAGSTELVDSTELLTDSLAALDMKAADAEERFMNLTRLANILAGAAAESQGSIDEFAISLTRKAGARIRAMNMDLEEGVAILQVFADAGLKGSIAGERFEQMMREMLRAQAKAPEMWEQMGVSLDKAGGGMQRMHETIRQIENALEDLSPSGQLQALFAMGFQARAIAAIQSQLWKSDDLQRYTEANYELQGAMDEMADITMESFSKKMQSIQGQISNASIAMGQTLEPVILAVAGAIGNLADTFSDLPGPIRLVISLGIALSATLGPIILGFGQFIFFANHAKVAVVALTEWWSKLSSAFKADAGTIDGVAKNMRKLAIVSAVASTTMATLPAAAASSALSAVAVAEATDAILQVGENLKESSGLIELSSKHFQTIQEIVDSTDLDSITSIYMDLKNELIEVNTVLTVGAGNWAAYQAAMQSAANAADQALDVFDKASFDAAGGLTADSVVPAVKQTKRQQDIIEANEMGITTPFQVSTNAVDSMKPFRDAATGRMAKAPPIPEGFTETIVEATGALTQFGDGMDLVTQEIHMLPDTPFPDSWKDPSDILDQWEQWKAYFASMGEELNLPENLSTAEMEKFIEKLQGASVSLVDFNKETLVLNKGEGFTEAGKALEDYRNTFLTLTQDIGSSNFQMPMGGGAVSGDSLAAELDTLRYAWEQTQNADVFGAMVDQSSRVHDAFDSLNAPFADDITAMRDYFAGWEEGTSAIQHAEEPLEGVAEALEVIMSHQDEAVVSTTTLGRAYEAVATGMQTKMQAAAAGITRAMEMAKVAAINSAKALIAVLKPALTLAIAVGAVVVVVKVLHAVWDKLSLADEFKEATAEAKRLNSELQKTINMRTQDIVNQANGMKTEEEKLKFLEEQTILAEKQLEDQVRAAQNTKDMVEANKPGMGTRILGGIMTLGASELAYQASGQEEMGEMMNADQQALLESRRQALEELNKATKDAKAQAEAFELALQQKAADAIAKMTQEIELANPALTEFQRGMLEIKNEAQAMVDEGMPLEMVAQWQKLAEQKLEMDMLAKYNDEVKNLEREIELLNPNLTEMQKALAGVAHTMEDLGEVGFTADEMKNLFDLQNAKAFQTEINKVEDAINKIVEENEALQSKLLGEPEGITDIRKEVERVQGIMAAGGMSLEDGNALIDQIKEAYQWKLKLTEADKIKIEMDNLIQSVQTPMEKLMGELETIMRAEKLGVTTAAQASETGGRLIDKYAEEELKRRLDSEAPEVKFAGALQAGSSDASSAITEAMAQRESSQQRLEKVNEIQADIQRSMAVSLEAIRRKLESEPDTQEVDI